MFVLVVSPTLLIAVVKSAEDEWNAKEITTNVKNAAIKKEMKILNLKRVSSVDLVMGGIGNVKLY